MPMNCRLEPHAQLEAREVGLASTRHTGCWRDRLCAIWVKQRLYRPVRLGPNVDGGWKESGSGFVVLAKMVRQLYQFYQQQGSGQRDFSSIVELVKQGVANLAN